MPEAREGAMTEQSGTSARPALTEQVVLQMAVGKWVCKALSLAADLGIADVLKDGPLRAAELALRTRSNEDALYRLLRALAAVGVFEEAEERRFANNALSSTLRSDVPNSVRAMIRWIGEEAAWLAWNGLAYSVRTGQPAFEHVLREQVFDYFKLHPQTGQIFNEAMTSFSAATGAAVARAYDFSRCKKVVDVGGGHGALLLAVTERFSEVEGVVFDRPEVIAGAHASTASSPGRRIELRAGDFFEGVPEGGDAYVMQHVVHDWDDERCVRILANCRSAMAPGGRVLVVEQVLRDGAEAAFSKLLDLEMLVMTSGGRERTEPEFASLFERAGLRLARVVPTESMVSVVEGVAASLTLQ
jgi:hypothetical protein